MNARPFLAVVPLALLSVGCPDLSDYSTRSDSLYMGCVVSANFVLSGEQPGTQACVTFDTDQMQGVPGTLTTSDGMFESASLRSIPQLWHDPLSTLNFGEGRLQNLVYMATPSADAGGPGDATVVVSLMSGGGMEVRVFRGAPPALVDAGAPASTPAPTNLFAVYQLDLKHGACDFAVKCPSP